ncbi:MAG: response regulator [Deltaproteobacteria bacterium]
MKELPKVYFERLLESSPDIVVAVDRKGTVIFYNDGATLTLGYTAKEVLGTHVFELYPSAEEAKRVMAAMRSETESGAGRVKNFETQFVDKDGKRIPVAVSGSIIYDEKEREQGSIGFAKDIEELRLHEQIATLGELAIGLAHEINNPLESLVNHADMLERFVKNSVDTQVYETGHDRIVAMKRGLRRIQTIVERVGEIAAAGTYGTIEYMPGRLMTDLGLGEEETGSMPAHDGNRHLSGKIILVVDDDEEIRSTMSEILGAEGCKVMLRATGLEALEAIKEQTPDLVISDVVMPDMDGYDLFREVNGQPGSVPVVLMTAYYYDKDHVIKRSKTDGLDDVIFKKPIDPERLLDLIEARVGG